MTLTVTGAKQIRPTYKMIFFRGQDNNNYLTHADREIGNSKRIWDLKQGQLVRGAVWGGNIINADTIVI